jgi:hypothetical protein
MAEEQTEESKAGPCKRGDIKAELDYAVQGPPQNPEPNREQKVPSIAPNLLTGLFLG